MGFGLKEAVLAVSLATGAIGCGPDNKQPENKQSEVQEAQQSGSQEIQPTINCNDKAFQEYFKIQKEVSALSRRAMGLAIMYTQELKEENQLLKTESITKKRIVEAINRTKDHFKGTPDEDKANKLRDELLIQLEMQDFID